MCGINGFLKKNTSEIEARKVLTCMNDRIIHRGPDDTGQFVETSNGYTIGLGMRRLAIIDLHSGNQPIFSENKDIVIVLNGEIYNYKELRRELVSQSVKFNTESDTEVVLKLYEKYNTSAFSMLDGMFALSIYDKSRGKVFIARDFFGEKPLYYSVGDNQIIWASELKSLLTAWGVQKPKINKEALNLFFRLTYIPAPHTVYEGIYKLDSNCYLELDTVSWDVSYHAIHLQNEIDTKQMTCSFEQAKKETHDLLIASVYSRSVSDVPIGTFLSGGVDSSIVSLLLAQTAGHKINTFSIGFEKKSFDETEKSKLVANLIDSNHYEFVIGEDSMKDAIESILLNFDEPFADSSAIPTYLVAQQTAKHVKVALTGDGGDEVFGGYNKYYMGKINHKYTSIVPQNIHKSICRVTDKILTSSDDNRGKRFKLRKLLHAVNYEGDFYYNIISLAFQQNEANELFNTEWQYNNIFDRYKDIVERNSRSITDFRHIDKVLSLEGDMLVKVDRTSMLASLECRAPFLNKKIWDYTSLLPDDFLIKGWDKKYLLKKAFESYFPPGFLDKSKQGFGVPVGDWLRGHLRKELESYIEKKFLTAQGIFKADYIIPLVQKHLLGKADNTFRVWTFYCFQKWYMTTYLK